MFTPMPGQSWEEAFADFSKAEALREQAWKRIGLAVGCTLGVALAGAVIHKATWGTDCHFLQQVGK